MMSPLIFALVDMSLHYNLQGWRRLRSRYRQYGHRNPVLMNEGTGGVRWALGLIGWWRSLWGVL